MFTREEILRGIRLHQEGLRRVASAYSREEHPKPVYTSEQFFEGQATALQFILSLYGDEAK